MNAERRRRGGLTLIEVVAATVLMATVVVASLAAQRSHRRSIAAAARRSDATRVLDRWLWRRRSMPGGIPIRWDQPLGDGRAVRVVPIGVAAAAGVECVRVRASVFGAAGGEDAWCELLVAPETGRG